MYGDYHLAIQYISTANPSYHYSHNIGCVFALFSVLVISINNLTPTTQIRAIENFYVSFSLVSFPLNRSESPNMNKALKRPQLLV